MSGDLMEWAVVDVSRGGLMESVQKRLVVVGVGSCRSRACVRGVRRHTPCSKSFMVCSLASLPSTRCGRRSAADLSLGLFPSSRCGCPVVLAAVGPFGAGRRRALRARFRRVLVAVGHTLGGVAGVYLVGSSPRHPLGGHSFVCGLFTSLLHTAALNELRINRDPLHLPAYSSSE